MPPLAAGLPSMVVAVDVAQRVVPVDTSSARISPVCWEGKFGTPRLTTKTRPSDTARPLTQYTGADADQTTLPDVSSMALTLFALKTYATDPSTAMGPARQLGMGIAGLVHKSDPFAVE